MVHGLVVGVTEVQADDFSTRKQLHDDGTRNDWTDAQVHDGTRSTSHDGAESTEQVQCLPGETKQHHVGHGEVNDEHKGGCPHLLVETNVAFGFGDGWVHVNESAECVETAAFVAFPHETGEDGCGSEAEQNNAHKEESDTFVVTPPCAGTNVPGSDGQEDQPTRQFPKPANKRHVFHRCREIPLETPHAVGHVDH